jgi:acetyl-CoA carboxylase biotin carboxylase subunit
VAAGEKLPFPQRSIQMRGHAIECRINAEDPYKFTPSPGRITAWHAPGGPGVRVDSHAYTNYFVPPHYDSMIGKIIVHGDTREQALARTQQGLAVGDQGLGAPSSESWRRGASLRSRRRSSSAAPSWTCGR